MFETRTVPAPSDISATSEKSKCATMVAVRVASSAASGSYIDAETSASASAEDHTRTSSIAPSKLRQAPCAQLVEPIPSTKSALSPPDHTGVVKSVEPAATPST